VFVSQSCFKSHLVFTSQARAYLSKARFPTVGSVAFEKTFYYKRSSLFRRRRVSGEDKKFYNAYPARRRHWLRVRRDPGHRVPPVRRQKPLVAGVPAHPGVYANPGNTKNGSITVLLTSCLTGLDWSVL
jgi:hypothetical protein